MIEFEVLTWLTHLNCFCSKGWMSPPAKSCLTSGMHESIFVQVWVGYAAPAAEAEEIALDGPKSQVRFHRDHQEEFSSLPSLLNAADAPEGEQIQP